MDERARRLWAGTEAGAIGWGGVAAVHQLQRVADKLDMSIHVSHFPPGTSKWNPEHRPKSRAASSKTAEERFPPVTRRHLSSGPIASYLVASEEHPAAEKTAARA